MQNKYLHYLFCIFETFLLQDCAIKKKHITSVIFWSLIYSPVKVAQSCPTLCDTMTVAHQAPLSVRVSRQEY